MQRREFLGTLSAIPLVSSLDFFNDDLTVDNFRYKLSGDYHVVDFDKESLTVHHLDPNNLAGSPVVKSKVVPCKQKFMLIFRIINDSFIPYSYNLVPKKVQPKPFSGELSYELQSKSLIDGDYPLLSKISASYAEKLFKMRGEHYIIINNGKIAGFSLVEQET